MRDAELRPTGDGYRDAFFGFLMQVFNEAHSTAVIARAPTAEFANQGALMQLDLAGWKQFLDPDSLYDAPFTIAGAGPALGTGRADIAATLPGVTRLWEVKYNSATGQAFAAAQLARYRAAALQLC